MYFITLADRTLASVGVLEGEVRILSAQLTVEQIFNDRKAFKETIISNVQEELELFGLQIYNANIKELQDSPGSEYFSCTSLFIALRRASPPALTFASATMSALFALLLYIVYEVGRRSLSA